METRFRRIAAMVCALALCASLLPAGALANNTDGIDVDASSSSQVVTGTEPTEEEQSEETASETEQPAEEAEEPGIAVMSLDPTEIYSADGIAISVQSGGAGWVPKTVNFKVIVDGTTVVENESIDVPTAATQLVVDAEGYDVTFDTTNDMTVTPGINNRYNVGFGSPDEYDCTINLVSSKTKDDIVITDGTTTYGTFSWSKVNAGNAAFTRTLTVLVNGEQVHQQTINTPKELTNSMATDQYWFTPNADLYLNSVEIEPALGLIQTDPYRDVTVKLTTVCGCGRDTCLCEGGCDCPADCTCDKCMGETLQDNQINTGYGILEYNPDATALYYNLTVEIYVNGQQKFVSEQLKVPGGITGAVNFEPADGYTYNMPNGYDMVVRYGTGSWDQNTGYIAFNGALPADQNYDNRLKIYLWTFNNAVNLDVERRLGIIDDVTGYTISYTVTDADGNPQTYTYEATSFGAGQTQTIPKGTPVTLTAICSMGKEVSQWSWAEGYQGGTSFTGTKGQDGSEAYGNSVTLVVDGSWSDRIMVYIDELSDVKAPTEDELIEDDGLHKIFEDGPVIIDCVNPDADHADREFGLLEGSFTVSELQGNSASGYYVDVTITDVDAYVDNSNLGQDVEHELAETATTKTIRLNWVVVQNENGSYTSAWKAEAPATIKVTCGEVEVPTKPDDPTITEIDDLLDVKVTCQNNPNHNKTFTELPADSYDISTPTMGKENYECTVTIKADSYIKQMAGDHKIVDGTPDSKKVLLAYVNDQWIVANEAEATVSFLAECVAPEAPDNITVAGLLKDVTVTCDEHNSKTYDIDDTTITVDKSSLRYDGNNEAFIVEVSVAAQNYVDQYIGDFGPHTLNDNESKTVTLLYQNGSWVLANKDAKVEFKVKCDTPDKPEYDEIAGLLGGVTVTCDVHGTGTYKLSDGNYEVGGIQGGGYGALVKVTVFGAAYVDKFEADHNNIAHKLVGSEQITISLVYQKDGWMIDSSDLGKTIAFQVTCKPDAPTTDEVDALKIKDAVTLDCINTSVNHADVTYDLKSGSYTIGEVVNGGNDLYYVSLTVRPDAYVRDYDKATGSTHTWPGNDYGIINLYWNNDTQAWETRGDYGVKFLVKCSTVTVPGDGGNNNDTPKDEHPDIAEGIANGTWGGTPTPTPAASATSTIPQTSDSMPIGLLAGTAAIAAAAIALLLVLRKRRQQ